MAYAWKFIANLKGPKGDIGNLTMSTMVPGTSVRDLTETGIYYTSGSPDFATIKDLPVSWPSLVFVMKHPDTWITAILVMPYGVNAGMWFSISLGRGTWTEWARTDAMRNVPKDTNVDNMRGPQWAGMLSIPGSAVSQTLTGTLPPGMRSWVPGQFIILGTGGTPSNLAAQIYIPYRVGNAVKAFLRTTMNFSLTGADAWSVWVDLTQNLTSTGGGGEANNQLVPDTGYANSILLQQFTRARGGSIGTNGTAAVTIRWDHNPVKAISSGAVELHQKYGIPMMWAHYSRQREMDPTGHGTEWSVIQDHATRDGFEVWSHSQTHEDATTQQGWLREIKDSRQELEAAMPRLTVWGFCIPGVSGTNYGGFIGTNSIDDFIDTDAGKICAQTYAVSTGHWGGRYRALTGEPQTGLAHMGIEQSNAVTVLNAVKEAQSLKAGLCLMMHPQWIGAPNGISLADYEAILKYLADERDAGRLTVLSGTGLLMADTRHSYRHNMLMNSGFASADQWTGNWTISNGSAKGSPSTGELVQSVNLTNQAATIGSTRELLIDVKTSQDSVLTIRRGTFARDIPIPAGGYRAVRQFGVIPKLVNPYDIGVTVKTGDADIRSIQLLAA